MKAYTKEQYSLGNTGLECMILSPAFINKQPRQVAEQSRTISRHKRDIVHFLDSGDRTILQAAGVALVMGLIYLLS